MLLPSALTERSCTSTPDIGLFASFVIWSAASLSSEVRFCTTRKQNDRRAVTPCCRQKTEYAVKPRSGGDELSQ
jgi:hypothetical protein